MIFKHGKFLKFIIPLTLSAALLVSGCSSGQNDTPGKTDVAQQTTGSKSSETAQQPNDGQKAAEEAQKKALDGYNSLVANNPTPQQLMKYLAGNLQAVEPEEASTMLLKLEGIQKKSLEALENKFNDENIQKKLGSIWKSNIDINTAISTTDADLKALLEETRDGGYKVETAEGTYFPIMDYGVYRGFSQFVTVDIKEYIDLMAVESDKGPAKDAALVISWDEVLTRAVNQERFLADYPESKRLERVKELYSKYLAFAFLGLDNTPAFNRDNKMMVSGLKEAYGNFLSSNTDQRLGQRFRNYVELLEKNKYKLTREVEDYRKTAMEAELG